MTIWFDVFVMQDCILFERNYIFLSFQLIYNSIIIVHNIIEGDNSVSRKVYAKLSHV